MSLLVQIGEELWVTLCFRGLHPDLFEKVRNLELAPILKAEKVNKRHSTPPLAPPTQTQISCICFRATNPFADVTMPDIEEAAPENSLIDLQSDNEIEIEIE